MSKLKVCGRELEPGMVCSISGRRGKFRYIDATITSENKFVLNFIGGTKLHEQYVSFYPERVTKIHRSRNESR